MPPREPNSPLSPHQFNYKRTAAMMMDQLKWERCCAVPGFIDDIIKTNFCCFEIFNITIKILVRLIFRKVTVNIWPIVVRISFLFIKLYYLLWYIKYVGTRRSRLSSVCMCVEFFLFFLQLLSKTVAMIIQWQKVKTSVPFSNLIWKILLSIKCKT